MIDQLFTAKNFRKIFDSQNRRGHDLASRFFPDAHAISSEIRDRAGRIRKIRAADDWRLKKDLVDQVNKIRTEISACRLRRSRLIDDQLQITSDRVLSSRFRIDIAAKMGPGGKIVYVADGSPESYFVLKQLQNNLRRAYSIKQSNRHDAACQVRGALAGSLGYEIVRLDVSQFYESIDRKMLLEKLDSDGILSTASKKFIRQVLDCYQKLSGMDRGLPRGIGISAYLAELVLSEFDACVRCIEGVVLHCRYVDDIVLILMRDSSEIAALSIKGVAEEKLLEVGLRINEKKTRYFNLSDPATLIRGRLARFEYLGYRFTKCRSGNRVEPRVTVEIGAKKITKYKFRMTRSFSIYNRQRSVCRRRAFRELIARLKFLTGNTKLVGNKSSAATGIYYSNSLANKTENLSLLDKQLVRLAKRTRSRNLVKRIKSMRFKVGFEERVYHNFNTHELGRIVKGWKYAPR
ncbi:reverse transcriptase (RNA-dependent DNA polymerase) [Tahibacter aquaticus]|uniref:Reverse transcriptase (RNA-dependent DNA polymerase) n=1 Tax=Tahibacter aquaticus TaxID=520092 RepID=A0A4R6YII9_9GAMM|nr:antiviral reverse transcriptase Drt3a [Tahibacter aquaticus]TDR36690.1 reverse transcriptase (RNA-dependent DNA polymerase) [Tahibacter aquaticus]